MGGNLSISSNEGGRLRRQEREGLLVIAAITHSVGSVHWRSLSLALLLLKAKVWSILALATCTIHMSFRRRDSSTPLLGMADSRPICGVLTASGPTGLKREGV
jgi:hypothetical protein